MDWQDLQGGKTYVVAIATICYALGGFVAGYLDMQTAIPLILGALGLSGLRHGIKEFINPTPETPPAPTY